MGYIDFKMFLKPNLYGDYGTFLIGPDDVLKDDWLGTGIMISLGTNKRVDGIIRVDNGWWGESILGKNIGSKLFLLDRSKNISETLQLARQYAEESLQWLVEDGHVRAISQVQASQLADNQYEIRAVLVTLSGEIREYRHIFSVASGV
jgi:phage gp46-like protein